MKVKLLGKICGPEGTFGVGDTPNLSDALATALIRDGHAVEIKTPEENIKKILSENPELKEAVKETIQELKKPENVVNDITGVMKKIEKLKRAGGKK